MAILSEQDRQRIERALNRYADNYNFSVSGMVRQHLRDAINNTDDFIDGNDVNYNSSLPQPVRGVMNSRDKTILFCAVALARVDISFLRKIFGEVD